jgi:DNA-binding MarR family transcriptional regulator/GNAT superfamily N-acetyltransferase
MSLAQSVRTIRRFNRLYTPHIGVLGERHLGSDFNLTEVRVLYELAHSERPTATAIARALDLDAGYLSRILAAFRRRGLVRGKAASEDRRQSLLALTPGGRRAFARLDERANAVVARMLERLDGRKRIELVRSLETARRLLDPESSRESAVLLRTHRPGDLGWLVEQHGALYAQEYGWDERFEALVASIVGDFGRQHDPRREACWIAERDGERVGSVMLVRDAQDETRARLRLLLVEPSARGIGLGRTLVETCTSFARTAGYRTIVLWTQSVLSAARAIYASVGYRKVSEEPHPGFGKPLVSETWELVI